MGILDAPGITKKVADATYSGVFAARPGNRIAYLGDSITQGSWQNSTLFQGSSVPLYAMLKSGGRLITVANAGLAGDRSDQALARFDSEVTPSAPTAVFILLGTNDIMQSKTLAEYSASMKAIVAKTRAIGAVPVLGTIPPSNTSGNHLKINTWNARLYRYASSQGIMLVDFYGLLVDPANGNYSSTYNSDGTHPNALGYVAMGQLVSDKLSPLAPEWKPYLSRDNTDALNLINATNTLMITDATADGVPDGWFAYGGSSGYAHALVTAAGVPGKMAQITQTANASLRAMQKGITASVGDRISISGVITTDGGVNAYVKVSFVGLSGNGSTARPASFQSAVTAGVFYQELTIPVGATGINVDLIAEAGTGVVSFGQITGINLTTNALLTL